jgi:predicted O-methyltransferase YrrM
VQKRHYIFFCHTAQKVAPHLPASFCDTIAFFPLESPFLMDVFMNRTLALDDVLHPYLLSISPAEHPVLAALREATAQENPYAVMQIAPEQGHFMAWLVKLLGVKRYLEIGVFTGYSALTVALAMPEEGRIVACDQSADFTNMARQYWAQAGMSHKIELHVAPAIDTLLTLAASNPAPFDMAFIDADKPSYPLYLETIYPLIKQGGLILVDNVFLSGKAAQPRVGKMTGDVIINRLNADLVNDPRFVHCVLPVGDGITLLIKQ